MKFGKILVFTILILSGISLVFSQQIARWDVTSGITIDKNVIVEGTTVKFSAKLLLLQSLNGLRIKGGIGRRVLLNLPFAGSPGQPGTTIEVMEFRAKVTKGNHRVWFKMIPPPGKTVGTPSQITKLIMVVPRMQTPNPNPSVQIQSNIPTNLCEANKDVMPDLKIEEFTAQYIASNNNVIYNYKVYNNSARCIKELKVYLYVNKKDGIWHSQVVNTVDSADRPGEWILKGYGRRTVIGNFHPSENLLAARTFNCSNNPNHKCMLLEITVGAHNINDLGAKKVTQVDLGQLEE